MEERDQNRLLVGVSVFHAYAHNWLCQMRYNPRLIAGFGFSDGENSERFWSKLSPLVRLNRTASSSLRLLNINFLVEHINEEQLKGLGERVLSEVKVFCLTEMRNSVLARQALPDEY